jgi:hypothetical protein
MKKKLKTLEIKKFVSQSTKKAKVIWNVFNDEIGRSKKQMRVQGLQIQTKGNTTVESDTDMTEVFSSEFSRIDRSHFNILSMGSHFPSRYKNLDKCFRQLDINAANVDRELFSINLHNPAGTDRIPGLFYKHYCKVFAPIVSYIFNASVVTGQFPECFKRAIVLPARERERRSNLPTTVQYP